MILRTLTLSLILGAWGGLSAQEGAAVFRSDVRLVEVYASVFDHHGRYLDGLPAGSFRLLDEGLPQPIVSFESNQSSLSCAILLDTTGSMFRALPGVKNAVLRLIDEFRGENSAAIYSFNTSLQVLQDFTSDKSALKTAVLRTRAAGETALFDSISQAAMAIGKRNGKKAMIVFTDGDDNASVLNANAALSRVKKLGIPIYSIAEGEAVTSPALSRGLKDISQVTGGVPYTVKKPKDVETVFQDISEDLQHGYMLTYKPPLAQGFGWRKIQLVVNGQKDYRLRAREGYLPE
jgi:Ca-activated chloride channel family protein